jgi:hypothetical protein
VKHLSLTLREPPERRNPMHTFVADREAYERAALLAWNTPAAGLDVLLFRVSGPTDPYRDALADARFVEAFDVTRIDDDRFYVYVEHRTREADRQREAITAASEVGYYDVPRTGSVAEVADRLGCAKSTASNHLRKAEARLVGEVV